MISTRIVDGVQTTTHDEGDWLFQRTGRAPWAATHLPTDTTVETGQTVFADAKRVVRETAPNLCGEQRPTQSGYTYVVTRGRQSAARSFTQLSTSLTPSQLAALSLEDLQRHRKVVTDTLQRGVAGPAAAARKTLAACVRVRDAIDAELGGRAGGETR